MSGLLGRQESGRAGARDLCSRKTFCAAVKVALVNSSAGSASRFPSPSIATFSRPALPLGASLSSPVWFKVKLAAAPGVATSAMSPHVLYPNHPLRTEQARRADSAY